MRRIFIKLYTEKEVSDLIANIVQPFGQDPFKFSPQIFETSIDLRRLSTKNQKRISQALLVAAQHMYENLLRFEKYQLPPKSCYADEASALLTISKTLSLALELGNERATILATEFGLKLNDHSTVLDC